MLKIKLPKRLFRLALCLLLLGALAVLGVNAYVKASVRAQILLPEQAAELADVDCVLVLGCHVLAEGQPGNMLADRLQRGVELYQAGAAPKLLMSGDHGQTDYDEVNTMKSYALAAGVPSADVFMDHAGFSTYESVYRARDIFGARKIIIVTQEYHLYRALYIARALGVEAYGVAADHHTYRGGAYREAREILARCKDFATAIFQPAPTYLGEMIPVGGNGDLTNDRT